MSSVRSQRIFLRRVGEALASYQLVEAALKLYIEGVHLRIQRLVSRRVPFHYPPSEYENASLGRLIDVFQRHSDNKQLIQRLRKAVKTRNYVAHRVVEDYMHHREATPRVAARISRDLKKLEDDGQCLGEELLKELAALREAYDEDRGGKTRLNPSMVYRAMLNYPAIKKDSSAILSAGRAVAKSKQQSSNSNLYTREGISSLKVH